jgi:hypothetical protein
VLPTHLQHSHGSPVVCVVCLQDPDLFELVESATSSSLAQLSPHSLSDLITAFARSRDPQAQKVRGGGLVCRHIVRGTLGLNLWCSLHRASQGGPDSS